MESLEKGYKQGFVMKSQLIAPQWDQENKKEHLGSPLDLLLATIEAE